MYDANSYSLSLPAPQITAETPLDDAFAALSWHLLSSSQRLAEQYRFNGHWRLLQDWVEPYFEVVGRVWETRTAEFAQNVAIGLYPSLLVSPEVVERTDAYLASQEVQPALARLLLEGRDGIARALRARARDAAAG